MIVLSGWDIFNKLWSLNNRSSKDFRTTARKVKILSDLSPRTNHALDAFSFFNLKEFRQKLCSIGFIAISRVIQR